MKKEQILIRVEETFKSELENLFIEKLKRKEFKSLSGMIRECLDKGFEQMLNEERIKKLSEN